MSLTKGGAAPTQLAKTGMARGFSVVTTWVLAVGSGRADHGFLGSVLRRKNHMQPNWEVARSQKDQGVRMPFRRTCHARRLMEKKRSLTAVTFPFLFTSATVTVKHDVTREASLPIHLSSRQTWSRGPLTSWAEVFLRRVRHVVLLEHRIKASDASTTSTRSAHTCLTTRWLRVFEDAKAKAMNTSIRQRNTILSEDALNKHEDRFEYETHREPRR